MLVGLTQQYDKLVFSRSLELSLRDQSADWSWQSPINSERFVRAFVRFSGFSEDPGDCHVAALLAMTAFIQPAKHQFVGLLTETDKHYTELLFLSNWGKEPCMNAFRVIEVKQSIFDDNNQDADRLRQQMKEEKTFLINLMSSPGSGKTTTLTGLINRLKDDLSIGIMEADIDSDVDADTLSRTGVKVIQLHTGGMCHLDADMTRQGIRQLGTEGLDLVVLENVGNLVCPAEFDTGAALNMMILSVPEGHDKPLKYPLIFQVCDILVINKIDVLPYFDFDLEKVREFALRRNPKLKIFPISAKTGEGVDALADYLRQQVISWNN